MKIKEIQLYNVAPFNNLHLSFDNTNVIILSGVNGSGKTTIISYIVDSIYEIAKMGFPNEFEGIEGQFYRISSDITVLDKNKHSFFYIRYDNEGEDLDYINIRNLKSEEDFNNTVVINNHIDYFSLKNIAEENTVVKYVSISDRRKIESIFSFNLLTYFPAYRYEQPAYLNNPYKVSLNFKKESSFSGYLTNPIEVTSDLNDVANWMMDIILDFVLQKNNPIIQIKIDELNNIFSKLLFNKIGENVQLGIGPRQDGATRIRLLNMKGQCIYPSIFNMSSGEHALISIFCELVRQADNLTPQPNQIVGGIVLIDEIDKHLHIKLQKEVLPELLALFPNVQFIVTSHSPFFSLGMADLKKLKYIIFDLDNNGIECTSIDNGQYLEVYNMMISENKRFADKYNLLLTEIEKSNRPLIITEGKTDWKHLKAAKKALNINDLDIEFCEFQEGLGDATLLKLLKNLEILSPQRVIIGVFDRDDEKICKELNVEKSEYLKLSENVFAFSIPLVNQSLYGNKISIEHYYNRNDLTKKDDDGRRIFLGNEFCKNNISKDSKYITTVDGIDRKREVCGVIDKKVFDINDGECQKSLALSKNDFAQMILDEKPFAKDIDFSNFMKIFDIIRKIISDK